MLVKDSKEVTSMVMDLRVKELRELLDAQNINSKGKLKAELIKSCLEINLNKDSQALIEKLSTDRTSSMNSRNANRSKLNESKKVESKKEKLTTNISNKQESQSLEDDLLMIQDLLKKYDQQSITTQKHVKNKISFTPLAFYNNLMDLLSEPLELKNQFGKSTTSTLNHCQFEFDVPKDFFSPKNKKLVDGKFKYTKQVYVRFGYIDNEIKNLTIQDSIPTDLHLTVNSFPAPLPEAKKTSNPNAGINRYFFPINVSHLVQDKTRCKIFWKNSIETRKFYVGIEYLETIELDEFMNEIQLNNINSEVCTTQMVKDKLQIDDSDFLVETNTLKVTLMCPLIGSRISIPGRAKTCKHVQCFDLKSYLMMNQKKPTWICPVCSQSAPWNTLEVDSLFKKILGESRDTQEVTFQKDGSWTSVLNLSKEESGYNSTEEEAMDTDESGGIVVDLCGDSSPDIIDLT